MASAMIDHLQKDKRTQALYFFFTFRNMSQNTLHELLRTYISQYLRLNPDLLPVADAWLDASAQAVASLTALKKHLKDIVLTCTDPEPIYLILDGLDECGDAEQSIIQRYLHDILREVVQNRKPHLVRLCVISREIKLEKAFNKLVKRKIRIGKTDNKVDINHYIISELNEVKETLEPYILLEESFVRELTETLTARAEGRHHFIVNIISFFFLTGHELPQVCLYIKLSLVSASFFRFPQSPSLPSIPFASLNPSASPNPLRFSQSPSLLSIPYASPNPHVSLLSSL